MTHKKLTKVKTCLVVAPLNTVLNWQNEFQIWLDEEDQMTVRWDANLGELSLRCIPILETWGLGLEEVMLQFLNPPPPNSHTHIHTPLHRDKFKRVYIEITVSACLCIHLFICVSLWSLIGWYLLNCPTLCNQTWYDGPSSWAGLSYGSCAAFNIKVTERVYVIKIWLFFYCIFWTNDPFATRCSLMVHHRKPECLVRKLDCCVQGQGHSEGSKWQLFFVLLISSEPFVTKLGMVIHHLEPELSCPTPKKNPNNNKQKLGLLTSRSRSQWGFSVKILTVFTIFANC